MLKLDKLIDVSSPEDTQTECRQAAGNSSKLSVSLIDVIQSHVIRYQLESKSYWQECHDYHAGYKLLFSQSHWLRQAGRVH